ncbi:histidine phosphatase family protein [Streptomyces sp. NPDC049954]|uniref:histidine phosphatase family protein n=1 Tax=Streptomyces sp. NPDC049954 TaxID=3155779 RepID=UPI00343E8B74
MPAPRTLYVVRHAEATPDESGLTEAGRRQARLLGERLREVPFSVVRHGPLPRAVETARLVAESAGAGRAGQLPLEQSEEAGDYVPHLPTRAELPADAAGALMDWLADTTAQEAETGAALAKEALRRFTGPVEGDLPRHELLVTHAFLVSWLVRDALDAPAWRWMGLNQANTGLTVLRYAPGRLPSVLVHNDLAHLPAELRWTGHSPELHV